MRLGCNRSKTDRTASRFTVPLKFQWGISAKLCLVYRCVYTWVIASAVHKSCQQGDKNLGCSADLFALVVWVLRTREANLVGQDVRNLELR